MKARYLTFIGTALALAVLGSNTIAQSSSVPKEIKLSQESSSSPQNLTKQAPKPGTTQPQQSQPQPQNQQAPQTEVSQQELQKFANIVKKLQPLQRGALSQIQGAIKQQNLSEQRFGEIYQSQKNPQAQPTKKVTPEEKKKFEQVNAEIAKIQETTQSKMEEAVRAEGLEIPRFNQIFSAIRSNPALMQKVQQMIQS
jgi:hypothetical protein